MKKLGVLMAALAMVFAVSCDKDKNANSGEVDTYNGSIEGFANMSFSGESIRVVENVAGVDGWYSFQFGFISNEDYENDFSLDLELDILFTEFREGVYPLVGRVDGSFYIQEDLALIENYNSGFRINQIYHRYENLDNPVGEVEITEITDDAIRGKVRIDGEWSRADNENNTWISQGDAEVKFDFAVSR